MKHEEFFDRAYTEDELGRPVRFFTERRDPDDPVVIQYAVTGEYHIFFDPRTHDLTVEDNEVSIRPKELPPWEPEPREVP